MLGKRIKKYLDENGIKYIFLAEKTKIPMNTISPILNGKREIKAEQYFLICHALGVPLDKFVKKDANECEKDAG